MYDGTKLPSKWVAAELSQIAVIIMGQSPDSSTYNEQNIGLPFFQGKAEFGEWYPTVQKYCSAPKKIAEPNDILISVRAPVGPTNICKKKSCIGRGLAAIRIDNYITCKYVFYYLRHIEKWIEQQGNGTTFKAITKATLEKIIIPIPPLKEQERIVVKLDELMIEVHEAKEHLEKIPNIIKQFKQSILASAISGDLTSEWRNENVSVSKNTISKYKIKNLSIPNEWSLGSINDLQTFTGSGSTPKGGKNSYVNEGIKFLRSQNIYPDGINQEEIAYIPEYIHHKMNRTQIKEGDVLLNITGASIGRSTIVPEGFGQGNVNQHVCIIRTKNAVLPAFLSHFLNSPYGQEIIFSMQQGMTRQALNLSQIKNIIIPLPSIEEQCKIVCKINSLFAIAKEIDKQYKSAREHTDSLPSSILARAFQGKLVYTDENDESALELLKKIRLENTRKKEIVSRKMNRRLQMEKKKSKSLNSIITTHFSGSFTFEQLQEIVMWDYETLKENLFSLIAKEKTCISQKFDKDLKKIVFERC